MNNSSASFRLPSPPEKRPSQWPAYVCIAGVVAAATVSHLPAATDSWSNISYPVIARIDSGLSYYGLAIGPEPDAQSHDSVPMIAVVFGRICADDSDPESEPRPTTEIEPTVPASSVIHPASLTTRLPGQDCEADEQLR